MCSVGRSDESILFGENADIGAQEVGRLRSLIQQEQYTCMVSSMSRDRGDEQV